MNEIDKGKIRASLFNFIIYTEDDRRVGYFTDLVKNVVKRFPCRILFIKKSDSPHDFFSIKDSIIEANDGEDICLQTTIEVGGNKINDVSYLIFPYLVPDLPNYLLWGQDPTKESSILPYLQRYASRLIFDAEGADNLAQYAHVVLDKIEEMEIDVTDLNWARFGGWRNVFFLTFDTADKIRQLKSASDITIVYNNKSGDTFTHDEAQAVYLQAWLATQLNWKYKGVTRNDSSTHIEYSTGKNTIFFELKPVREETFNPGSIIHVDINAKGANHYSLLRRKEAPQVVGVVASNADVCDLPFNIPLSNQQQGISFTKETLYGSTSPNYKAMLNTLSKEFACTIAKKKKE
jgi:glucose-6-phosphate dehydrogenase assembly protein OpcA